MGDNFSIKPPYERPVERINFRSRAKVVFEPKETKKEMLYGSVIWFKPKNDKGNNWYIFSVIP